MKNREITWLASFAEDWLRREQNGRVPHAVALAGRPGVGKRAAAAWLVHQRLRLPAVGAVPVWPFQRPSHADLHWVTPPEDRHSIGIEQVRDLVADLALTSYEGRGKVAVLEPANCMTDNAANSLLKTLEEPHGDALIVLIVDRVGRLPATIFSRCQRLRFAVPAPATSRRWLDSVDPQADWERALSLAGGAPLLALARKDDVEQAATMAREFADVASGKASPLEIASRWRNLEAPQVLDWLANQVQACIRQSAGVTRADTTGLQESVLRHMDRRNLFCYLDIINGLRAQAPGSYNPELTLESLLIDWSDGLSSVRNRFGPGVLLPGTKTG